MIHEKIDFILSCAIVSIKIAAIYICFRPSMIFGFVRSYYGQAFDELCEPNYKLSKILQKPLWDCVTCMSSFWTIIITGTFEINSVLVICFFNYLLSKILPDE